MNLQSGQDQTDGCRQTYTKLPLWQLSRATAGEINNPNEWWIYSLDKLYYAHIKPLTLKCDLDLWARDMGLVRNMLSPHGEHLCQVSSKSVNKWWIYSPDKMGWTGIWTNERIYTKPLLWQLSQATTSELDKNDHIWSFFCIINTILFITWLFN